MNILIINLTRMGDILQSGPLVYALKQKYSHAKIHYLSDSSFKEIQNHISAIDYQLTIDVKKLLTTLINNTENLLQQFNIYQDQLEFLNLYKFDLVINLTHTDESKVLTAMANGTQTVGITMDEFGYRIVKHPWENYFYCSNLNRSVNRINLVDLYLRLGNYDTSPRRTYFDLTEEMVRKKSSVIERFGLNKPYFCIQLGASVGNKQYPPKHFATIANQLAKTMGLTAVFVGTKSENNLLNEAASFLKTPSINLLGQTDLTELGIVLKNSQFLITNDTGTMHIAAGLEKRIFCIALATAYSHETAPYGEGNIIFEAEISCTPCSHHVVCLDPVCKDYISPAVISYCIENYSLISQPGYKLKIPGTEKMKIFITRFDSENYLRLFPITDRPAQGKDILNSIYHYLWIKTLGYEDYKIIKENHDFVLYAKHIVEELKGYYSYSTTEIVSELQKFRLDFNLLKEISSNSLMHTQKLWSYYQNKDIQNLKIEAVKLVDFDSQITNSGLINPHLRPLTFLFQFDKDNLDNNNVENLLLKTMTIYDLLNYRTGFIINLADKICTLL